jgi:hypothetical protein
MVKSVFLGTKRVLPGFFLTYTALALIAGCGLFTIRDVVAPDETGDGIPRKQAIDPDSVLCNLEVAIRYKIGGLGLYEDSLAESFFLVLDIVDVQELGVAGLDSLSKSEDAAAQRLVSTDSPDSFYFAFGEVTPERTDTTAFYLDIPYELQMIDDEGVTVETIKGKADVTVAEDNVGTWAVTRWVDQREDPFLSFGRWHGERAIQTAPKPPGVLK